MARHVFTNTVPDSAGRLDNVQNIPVIVPTHPDYDAQEPDWNYISDLAAGSARVRSKMDMYLIPTELERKEGKPTPGRKSRYQQRLERSPYMNYVKRLKRYAMAHLFREDIVLPKEEDLPDSLKPLLKNADMLGTGLQKFFQSVGERAYEMGIQFVLVDKPDVQVESLQDELNNKARVFFTSIDPRDVVNWNIRQLDDGSWDIEWINIRTTYIDNSDPFKEPMVKTTYTVWYKDRWETYEPDETAPQVAARGRRKEIRFTMVATGDHPVGEVPVVPVPINAIRPMYSPPPLLEAGHLSVDHYNVNSMYINGLMYHLNPLLTFSGVTSDEQVKRGADYAVYLPQMAEAKYVEFQGGALSIAKETAENLSMEIMESGLRNTTTLGANTSAEARRLARSDFNSFHEAVAENFDIAFKKVLEMAAKWENVELSEKAIVKMNKDFDVTVMDAAMAEFLLRARQAGEISRERMFEEMKRGEVFSAEIIVEDEIKKAKEDGPSEMALTAAQIESGMKRGQGQPPNPDRTSANPK